MTNIHAIKYNKKVRTMCDKLGFDYREDSDGYALYPTFLDIEKFEFTGKWAYGNTVTIGRTPKGYWSYGIFLILGSAGAAGGISIFGKMFDNRRECLIAGIKDIENSHKESIAKALYDHCGNYDTRLNRKVIDECNTLLSELEYGKQLELFTI